MILNPLCNNKNNDNDNINNNMKNMVISVPLRSGKPDAALQLSVQTLLQSVTLPTTSVQLSSGLEYQVVARLQFMPLVALLSR